MMKIRSLKYIIRILNLIKTMILKKKEIQLNYTIIYVSHKKKIIKKIIKKNINLKLDKITKDR